MEIVIKVPEDMEEELREILKGVMKVQIEKLRIVKEIGNMNLLIDDWDEMEKEIVRGAVE